MKTKAKTNGRRELTLKDRLSRLTYVQACKLLGTEGERLIRHGGGYEIDIDEDVYFGGDLFRLRLDTLQRGDTPKGACPSPLVGRTPCHRGVNHDIT